MELCIFVPDWQSVGLNTKQQEAPLSSHTHTHTRVSQQFSGPHKDSTTGPTDACEPRLRSCFSVLFCTLACLDAAAHMSAAPPHLPPTAGGGGGAALEWPHMHPAGAGAPKPELLLVQSEFTFILRLRKSCSSSSSEEELLSSSSSSEQELLSS